MKTNAPKRWTDADGGATDAERALLSAGKKGSFALSDARKAELRQALATTLAAPTPTGEGGNEGGDGSGQVSSPSTPSPPTPPAGSLPTASTAASSTAASGIAKVLLSGKASAGLLAFGLAASGTAVVLGVATRTSSTPRAVPHEVPAMVASSPRTPSVAAREPGDGAGVPTTQTEQENTDRPSVPVPDPGASSRASGAAGRRSDGAERTAVHEQEAIERPPTPDVEAPPSPATGSPPQVATPSATAALLPASATPLVVPSLATSRLAEESARVREARDRLRGGDARGALESLTALARDIPGGTLIQEREALFIEALSATGRTAEARVHARHFLERYPQSAFVGRVRPFAGEAP